MELVVGIVDDDIMVNGTDYSGLVGVKYKNTTMWVGKICFTYESEEPELSSVSLNTYLIFNSQ